MDISYSNYEIKITFTVAPPPKKKRVRVNLYKQLLLCIVYDPNSSVRKTTY